MSKEIKPDPSRQERGKVSNVDRSPRAEEGFIAGFRQGIRDGWGAQRALLRWLFNAGAPSPNWKAVRNVLIGALIAWGCWVIGR